MKTFIAMTGRILRRCLLWVGAGLLWTIGCATSASPPPDRLAPDQLQNGPSLYETGRIAEAPVSSSGLRIDEDHPERRVAAEHRAGVSRGAATREARATARRSSAPKHKTHRPTAAAN